MRARLLLPVTLVSALALAACGSTNYKDTDHIIPAPDTAQTLKPPPTKIPKVAPTTTPKTSTTASVPSSGPLSTEPKITVPSGPPPTKLESTDIVKGTGAVAESGDELTVDYVGALYKNGKVFGASWTSATKSQPFPFELSVGEVIKGWVQGLAGMRVGGRRELIIPPSLGYGKAGNPPSVPGNATLIFIVDLLAVSSPSSGATGASAG